MYRIVSGEEVRPAKSDKEVYEVERLGNIVHEYFPELTEKYFCIPEPFTQGGYIFNFCIPEPYTQGGYIFNFFIDKESGMPVAIGCDNLKYISATNKIEPVPDTLTMSPVFNEDEMIEKCLYLRKRYHEILKKLKITDIKNCGGEYVVG